MVVAAVFGALAAARLLVIITPGTKLLDGLTRFFDALGWFGVDPEAAALAVNIMLRSILWLVAAVRAHAEALGSRVLHRGLVWLMAPLLVATVGHARTAGEPWPPGACRPGAGGVGAADSERQVRRLVH